MSGGSYDYLCQKTANEILSNPYQFEQMVSRLEGMYPKSRAAFDARMLEVSMRLKAELWGIRLDALRDVFNAIEWMDSGDSGRDEVEKAVKAYAP